MSAVRFPRAQIMIQFFVVEVGCTLFVPLAVSFWLDRLLRRLDARMLFRWRLLIVARHSHSSHIYRAHSVIIPARKATID